MINDTVVETKWAKTNATYWRNKRGCHGLDRMIDEFTTTYVSNSAYHHKSWWGVLDATLCGKVCQWLATGWWFSPGTHVSSTNKTDHNDIAEILLKVVLNTIKPNHDQSIK